MPDSFVNIGWTSPGGLLDIGLDTSPGTENIGDQEARAGRNALDNIPGTAKGAIPTDYTIAAERVYPHFDGVNNLLPGLPTDLSTFATWHSAHQAQYLKSQPGEVYEIKPGSDTLAFYFLTTDNIPLNALSITLSDYAKLHPVDQAKLRTIDAANSFNILETLGLTVATTSQKNLIFDNPAATGSRITELPPTQALALSTLPATDKAVFKAQFDLLRAELDKSHAINLDVVDQKLAAVLERLERADAFYAVAQRPPEQLNISSTIIHDRLVFAAATGPFDYDGGGDEGTSTASATGADSFVQGRVSSLDDGGRISQGYDTFMQAERQILNNKNRRAAIAESATFKDPKLDLATLIFQFQLLYEGEYEGVADSGTEEIRQLHGLLEDYGVMQRLINETLKEYDPGESSELRRFMNIGEREDGKIDETQAINKPTVGDPDNEFSDVLTGQTSGSTTIVSEGDRSPLYHWSVLAEKSNDVSDMYREYTQYWYDGDAFADPGDYSGKLDETEMRAFSMFAQASWASAGGRDHPIERLLTSFTRPTHNFITQDDDEGRGGALELHSKTAFDTFQTSLSDAITILNQENQLKQNEIENATKQQNRHFELGNNALRKMNDLLLTIGRV